MKNINCSAVITSKGRLFLDNGFSVATEPKKETKPRNPEARLAGKGQ